MKDSEGQKAGYSWARASAVMMTAIFASRVLGMLRDQEHETHMNWAEARALIRAVAPQRTILVHMGPEVRYADWQARLPAGVELAVDGLTATFTP